MDSEFVKVASIQDEPDSLQTGLGDEPLKALLHFQAGLFGPPSVNSTWAFEHSRYQSGPGVAIRFYVMESDNNDGTVEVWRDEVSKDEHEMADNFREWLDGCVNNLNTHFLRMGQRLVPREEVFHHHARVVYDTKQVRSGGCREHVAAVYDERKRAIESYATVFRHCTAHDELLFVARNGRRREMLYTSLPEPAEAHHDLELVQRRFEHHMRDYLLHRRMQTGRQWELDSIVEVHLNVSQDVDRVRQEEAEMCTEVAREQPAEISTMICSFIK